MEEKKYQPGDRVRVNCPRSSYLQKDNRVGTIISVSSMIGYYLKMDKPVIKDPWTGSGFGHRNDIPQGYCYFTPYIEELKPILEEKTTTPIDHIPVPLSGNWVFPLIEKKIKEKKARIEILKAKLKWVERMMKQRNKDLIKIQKIIEEAEKVNNLS